MLPFTIEEADLLRILILKHKAGTGSCVLVCFSLFLWFFVVFCVFLF